jgi:hypothetical protein
MRIHRILAILVATPLALVPALVSAQEPQAPQACVAELTPSEIEGGAAAVKVTVKLSQEIGAVGSIQAEGPSGIKVADPTDLAMTDLASPGQTPQPIQMAADNTTWTLYLNTTAAEPGEHRFALKGISADCAAAVTVK